MGPGTFAGGTVIGCTATALAKSPIGVMFWLMPLPMWTTRVMSYGVPGAIAFNVTF